MIHHIHKLIAEGEHQQLDFKFEVADAHKIARTLVAFANTDGGRLLIGVKDNGAISGVRSEEEYYMVESAARICCKPEVLFTVKEWTMEKKKKVLEVIIPKSHDKPHFALQDDGKWLAYHRVADQNFPVNRILAQVWKLEKQPRGVYLQFTEAEKFLLSWLEVNDSITMLHFQKSTGLNRKSAERILVKFILLKLIRMHFTENHIYFSLHPEYLSGTSNS